MIINIFYSIFCIHLKTLRFWLSFQCRNEFCMQKYPNTHIFIIFAENSHLCLNFCKGYSLAIFHVTAKTFISTNLAIFGFFPSKKHDPIGIINFCLKLLEKITKNKKIMLINIFDSISCIFLKTHRFWLSFQCRNEF